MGKFLTRALDCGVTVFAPDGRLNATVAARIRQALEDLVEAGSTRIVVDMAAVEAIDSSGLGALISGLKAARRAGGDLRLVSPAEQVIAVLEMTNLHRVLAVCDSAEGAFSEPT